MQPRKRIAIDVETFCTVPGLVVPKLVCMSVSDGKDTRLFHREAAIRLYRELIHDDSIELVGHHIPFDLAVLAKEAPDTLRAVFRAFRGGRARCTMVRQQLIDIAEGFFRYYFDADGRAVKTRWGLDQLAWRHLKIAIQKGPGTFRKRYHELIDIPIEEWPREARTYAMNDAEVDWKVAEAQDEYVGHEEFPTEILQMNTAWSLHLMSAWGVRTNPKRTAECRDLWKGARRKLDEELQKVGVIRSDGSKDTKKIAALLTEAFAAIGRNVPLTKTGKVSLDKQLLKDAKHPILKMLTERNKISKYIETYLPILLAANQLPFNPNWKTLVQSGRTACGAGNEEDDEDQTGNLQNLPKDGPVRGCFEARPGMLYCSTDLDSAEMRSLAEVCIVLGFDPVVLADELRAGQDPHLSVAAQLLGISYEQAEKHKNDPRVDAMRNLAKVYNFGLPGGMGAESFVEYAKGYGLELDVQETKQGITVWKGHYREMPVYFRYISRQTRNGLAKVRHVITGFVRAGMKYTDCANHNFQHLTSCCAKDGHNEITFECFTGESSDGEYDGVKRVSPLFGSRPVMFVHDETVTEVPEFLGHEAGHRQALLMKRSADKYIKHVPNSCSPALMKNLHKKAKAVYREGRLVEWTPPAEKEQVAA